MRVEIVNVRMVEDNGKIMVVGDLCKTGQFNRTLLLAHAPIPVLYNMCNRLGFELTNYAGVVSATSTLDEFRAFQSETYKGA